MAFEFFPSFVPGCSKRGEMSRLLSRLAEKTWDDAGIVVDEEALAIHRELADTCNLAMLACGDAVCGLESSTHLPIAEKQARNCLLQAESTASNVA